MESKIFSVNILSLVSLKGGFEKKIMAHHF